MQRTEYLVDLLQTSAIDSPAEDCVHVEKMILGRETETAVFQHPPSSITFPSITIGKHAMLSFGCGIKQVAWPHVKNAVRFTISVATTSERKVIFRATLQPRRRKADRGWHRHELDLARFQGQSIRIVLQTQVGWRRSTEYAWAGWANPRIVHELSESTAPARRDPHPHIFLITADALAARYLACYGHPTVQTPGIDRLAAEGVLVEQAWSQSCMTFGSYVSMLTGHYPHEHGVTREWQPFPVSHVSLPRGLQSHGYHTLFAASSREISGRNNHLDQVFDEVLPTFSNPMQDGALTSRQFIRAFENRPDQSCFCWLQYFDVHPPSMAPAPFSSMYYSGDPTDHSREYLRSEIDRIRSVESALIIGAAMPLLEKHGPVAEVLDILEDTAAVLMGRSDYPPDLAEHLVNLGTRATQGRSPNEFGEWLSEQTEQMRAGYVSDPLVRWLKEVIKLLERTESDIMSWLSGVVDFRYPLDMYLSTVSYFDEQVKRLTSYLRDQNLYDQSLIIVTAPHGEILYNPTIPYHHFLLAPDTLHVPLIMKLPKQAGARSGTRINGVFDLVDLFPTIMDIQELKHSFRLSGVSRCSQIKSGENIPGHDSFATGMHQTSHSVCRPPYLLARKNADVGMVTFHERATGRQEVLYDINSGDTRDEDSGALVESLRESLSEWRHGVATLSSAHS